MASSTIERNTVLELMDITFTHAGYDMWNPSTRSTHYIIQSHNSAYFITGDGTDYCGIIKRNGGSIAVISQSESPVTIKCIVVRR